MQSVDKYVYPGTTVLINKFNCQDAEKLREIEALSTGGNLAYLQLHPIKGKYDFKHLKDIHHFIFQDMFDWAGQIQTTHKEMLEASIQSFNTGNNDGFVSIFGRNIIPIDEYKEYQKRNRHSSYWQLSGCLFYPLKTVRLSPVILSSSDKERTLKTECDIREGKIIYLLNLRKIISQNLGYTHFSTLQGS